MSQGWYTNGCCWRIGLGGSGWSPWQGLLPLSCGTTLGCSPPHSAAVAVTDATTLWPYAVPIGVPRTRWALAPHSGPCAWPCCRRPVWVTAPCCSLCPWATAPWRRSTMCLVTGPYGLVVAVALASLARPSGVRAMWAIISGPMPTNGSYPKVVWSTMYRVGHTILLGLYRP